MAAAPRKKQGADRSKTVTLAENSGLRSPEPDSSNCQNCNSTEPMRSSSFTAPLRSSGLMRHPIPRADVTPRATRASVRHSAVVMRSAQSHPSSRNSVVRCGLLDQLDGPIKDAASGASLS
jgi:hypothetical protein